MEDFKQRDKDFAKALKEFTLILEILKAFAEEYDENRYDDRNEYACKASKLLIDYFTSDKFDKEDYPKLT